MMSKYLLFFILTLPSFVCAEEKEDGTANVMKGLMVTAKATGMCGVFSQMANFQATTNMSGGDEFIVRFISTEAVRLGYTLESLLETCQAVAKKHNESMKMLGIDL